ncbi:transposase [Streptomyces sp. NPDC017993]|uniref:transposase n=1 Tax=Streptomyces sp. NPDC017993 TaxID=3365027 RepID=UPI0037AF05AC
MRTTIPSAVAGPTELLPPGGGCLVDQLWVVVVMLGWGVTDGEWAVLEPSLPRGSNGYGRWRDHRHVINGILHRPSTGGQWRKLPDRFGSWQTVHKRHMLWSADGTREAAAAARPGSRRRRRRRRLVPLPGTPPHPGPSGTV